MRTPRVCLDAEGKYCIGRGDGLPLTVAENESLSLADVPATFVQASIPNQLPNNLLLPDFLEQMQPHQILAGEEPVLKLRLTHLSDGCVLGFSVFHMLAGILLHFGSAVQGITSALMPCCRK